MAETKTPFVSNSRGYPTEHSVRRALDECGIGVLSDLDALYMEHRGPLAPLIAENCQTVHLERDYPKAFTAISMAAVQSALGET